MRGRCNTVYDFLHGYLSCKAFSKRMVLKQFQKAEVFIDGCISAPGVTLEMDRQLCAMRTSGCKVSSRNQRLTRLR